MDLTRLYNLTTPELREEAERLGVDDTYALSRGQLIQAIRHKSTPPEPDGLLGKVFGLAKWALQAAGETRAKPVSEEAVEIAAARSDRETGTAPKPEPVSPPDPPAAQAREVPSPSPVPAPATASAPARVPEGGASAGGTQETGPPSRPPAGVFSSSAGLFEEPFPTRTMARILAGQGHYKRSLAIYAQLLNDEPNDQELLAEVDEVRARARTGRSHPPP